MIASGVVLNTILNPAQENPTAPWAAPQNSVNQSDKPTQAVVTDTKDLSDNYILIKGGSFMMGSPESENWRGDDET